MTELRYQHCTQIEKGAAHLTEAQLHQYLQEIPQWSLTSSHTAIHREIHFKNYYQTMAFVNAVAWVAHEQDHHPDLEVGYSRCKIVYTSHIVAGLSVNDFICAAHIDALLS